MAYETLADWFEFLNDDCDYQRWSQYFLQGLEALGAGNRGLEIGCGSGAFTRVLTRAGYFVTGTDVSAFGRMIVSKKELEELSKTHISLD